MHNLKKNGLSIADYVLKIKTLSNELAVTRCGICDEEKIMFFFLTGLDEYFVIFSRLLLKMLTKEVIIGDAKALLLNHESRLERRRTSTISALPSVKFSFKDSGPLPFHNFYIRKFLVRILTIILVL